MDFALVEQFVRKHSVASMLVAVVVAPGTWAVASTFHSERVAVLEERLTSLEQRAQGFQADITSLETDRERLRAEVAALEEIIRRRAQLPPSRIVFNDLYTESSPQVISRGTQ